MPTAEEIDDLLLLAEEAPEELTPEQVEYVRQLVDGDPATALEAQGWRVWYAEMFGQSFVDALDSSETEDRHHSEAIEWHWKARRALIHIELEDRKLKQAVLIGALSKADYQGRLDALHEEYFPTFLAYFTIWSRGHLKTTIARRVTVADACLSTSAGVGGYALIVGGTKKKVARTASSVEVMLRSPKIRQYYPKLSEVKRGYKGASKGWRADFLNTEAGYVFDFAGLDEGMAGANEEDVRPTLIMPDDLDQRSDSEVIAESNFYTFTHEILPMRQWNTLVWWAQNLISRFSCMYRVWKQQARVLTNRVFTNPIPAVRDLVTEVRTIGGIVKDVYVSGKPTSRLWDVRRIQAEIDTEGLPAFKKECQHEVDQDREGLVLQNYDDGVHVITLSEFEAVYGVREIPRRWYKYVFNDWARTKTKHHANVAGVVTVSSQNEPLPGCAFLFHPMSFPAGTAPEDVAVRLLTTMSPYATVRGERFTWERLVKSTLQATDLNHLIHDTTKLLTERRKLLASVIPDLVDPIRRSQNYVKFRGSHEQHSKKDMTGALTVYKKVFGLPFDPTNPGGDGGVDMINLLMKVDYSEPHRIKPGVVGFTNFFVVVPDDKAEYQEAMTPDDLTDSDLFRYQAKNCRNRDPFMTVEGEKEGGILKLNDDFINGLMMLFHDNCVQAAPMTYGEKVDALTPDKYKRSTLKTDYSPERELAVNYQEARAKSKIRPTVRQWDYLGNEVGVEEEE
jgi:hypothetical protein